MRPHHRDAAEFELGPGVHALAVDRSGQPVVVEDTHEAIARLSIDRRGVWLRIRDDVRGLHVNGRPVRRVAHLRGGDCIFVEGEGLTLLGRAPEAPPRSTRSSGRIDPASALLRSVGGEHHGRCFRVAGDAGPPLLPENDIRWSLMETGLVLETSSMDGVQVNGHTVHRAVLHPGDQVAIAGRRYVVETGPSPMPTERAPAAEARPAAVADAPRSAPRVPWLLVAAALIAAALTGLLLYGAR